MLKLTFAIGCGVGISLVGNQATAAGVCSEPVPRYINQMLRQQNNAATGEQAKSKIQELMDRYCHASEKLPESDYREDIGGGCVMYSGLADGQRVYWGTCSDISTEPAATPAKKASYWKHNDSIVYLTADGANRRFFYEKPRDGLQAVGVTSGTLLFEGRKDGYAYSGTAYIFSRTCGAIAYPVTGNVSADERTVTMYGQAPQMNSSCEIVSYRNDVLAFHFQRRAQD